MAGTPKLPAVQPHRLGRRSRPAPAGTSQSDAPVGRPAQHARSGTPAANPSARRRSDHPTARPSGRPAYSGWAAAGASPESRSPGPSNFNFLRNTATPAKRTAQAMHSAMPNHSEALKSPVDS